MTSVTSKIDSVDDVVSKKRRRLRHRREEHGNHWRSLVTTTPSTGRTVTDMATWQAARDELLVREKAHAHEGDAIAAAPRRLPMVEFDGTVEVVGPDGPV